MSYIAIQEMWRQQTLHQSIVIETPLSLSKVEHFKAKATYPQKTENTIKNYVQKQKKSYTTIIIKKT
jgi:hypothetical protein